MEIREYDDTSNTLNSHINNNFNFVYKITRMPPIILLKEEEFKNNVKTKWNYNDDFFNQHEFYFKKNEIKNIHFNNKINYVINVNYQPFGTTYYHAITVKNPITFCHIFLENVSEMIEFLGS
jgi:hypothetical protein